LRSLVKRHRDVGGSGTAPIIISDGGRNGHSNIAGQGMRGIVVGREINGRIGAVFLQFIGTAGKAYPPGCGGVGVIAQCPELDKTEIGFQEVPFRVKFIPCRGNPAHGHRDEDSDDDENGRYLKNCKSMVIFDFHHHEMVHCSRIIFRHPGVFAPGQTSF